MSDIEIENLVQKLKYDSSDNLIEIFNYSANEGIKDLNEIVIKDILTNFEKELDMKFEQAANYFDETNINIIDILEE